MLLKCYTHYVSKFRKQWPQDWKRSVSFQSQRRAMPKNVQNNLTIALNSHASKIMLKILQARLQQYLNQECQKYKLHFKETEEPEIELLTPLLKPLCGSQQTVGNS